MTTASERSTSELRISAPRLIAEFFVIVIGVLGALAADQWVQDRQDRELEAEYLDRLRADAGYDRAEIEFVQGVSRVGLAAIDSLLDPGFAERASDDDLLNAALLAASAREVDLSRGTWEELVASGRIALLEDAGVRLALADYDRFVREINGYWDYTDNDLWAWVMRRVPVAVHEVRDSGCGPTGGSGRNSVGQTTIICELRTPPGSGDWIRREIRSEEAVGELRIQRRRYQGMVTITEALLDGVDDLELVLNESR